MLRFAKYISVGSTLYGMPTGNKYKLMMGWGLARTQLQAETGCHTQLNSTQRWVSLIFLRNHKPNPTPTFSQLLHNQTRSNWSRRACMRHPWCRTKRSWPLFSPTFGPGVLACATRGGVRSEAGHCFHLLFSSSFSYFSPPSTFHPLLRNSRG